jgi:hypothetical protein
MIVGYEFRPQLIATFGDPIGRLSEVDGADGKTDSKIDLPPDDAVGPSLLSEQQGAPPEVVASDSSGAEHHARYCKRECELKCVRPTFGASLMFDSHWATKPGRRRREL